MKTGAFLLSLALAVVTGCADATDQPDAKQSAPAPAVPAPSEQVAQTNQVIAYYFHATIRCETCLKIEKQAHELIQSRFAAQLTSGRIVFKSVNYEQPDNLHFLQDYKLPCPSLVLVRQKNGKDQEWKLLGQTWDFVHIPAKLDQYIEEETSKFLEAAK